MPEPKARSIETVLLTGATGYVGIHVLHELVTRTDAVVTCLVRAPGAEAGKKRLLDLFAWYFPEFDLRALDKRVAVAAGDASAERLGLSANTYDHLSETQRVIINSAAALGESGSTQQFQKVNVAVVAGLLELAGRRGSKEVHHLSTVNVAGSYRERPAFDSFRESHLIEGQTFSGAYAETKYQAEVMMRSRFCEGLAGAVYRLGYIAPHSITGRFQRNIDQNHRARVMRSIVRLGIAAHHPAKTLRMTPVDHAAKGLLTLLLAKEPRGETYYVQTPREVSQQQILAALHAGGYPIRLLDAKKFAEAVPFIAGYDDDVLNASRKPRGDELITVPPNGDWSVAELRRFGFEFPRLSSGWFGRFLQHCIEIGFLEAPRFWGLGPVIDEPW